MLLQSILLLVPAAIAVIINQATYNCTPPVVHHKQAGSNLGCRPAVGNGREGKNLAEERRRHLEHCGEEETENGRRTDGLCLYVKKKTFLGQNKKSYFYVKTAYVFMFLCFWECSNIMIEYKTVREDR
jgi:hypothetical protein